MPPLLVERGAERGQPVAEVVLRTEPLGDLRIPGQVLNQDELTGRVIEYRLEPQGFKKMIRDIRRVIPSPQVEKRDK